MPLNNYYCHIEQKIAVISLAFSQGNVQISNMELIIIFLEYYHKRCCCIVKVVLDYEALCINKV